MTVSLQARVPSRTPAHVVALPAAAVPAAQKAHAPASVVEAVVGLAPLVLKALPAQNAGTPRVMQSANAVMAQNAAPAAAASTTTAQGTGSTASAFQAAVQGGLQGGWDVARGPVTAAVKDTAWQLVSAEGSRALSGALKQGAAGLAPAAQQVGSTFVASLARAAGEGGASAVIGAGARAVATEGAKTAATTGAKAVVQGAGGSLPAVGNVINAGFAVLDGVDYVKSCLDPRLNGLERMGKMLKFQCSAAACFLPAGSGLVSLAGGVLASGVEGAGRAWRESREGTDAPRPAADPGAMAEKLKGVGAKLVEGGHLDDAGRKALDGAVGILKGAAQGGGLDAAGQKNLDAACGTLQQVLDKGLKRVMLESGARLQDPEVAGRLGATATKHAQGALQSLLAMDRAHRGSARVALPEQTATWAGHALRGLGHAAAALAAVTPSA